MVHYEWCIETYTADEHEDITELNFSDKLECYNPSDFTADEGEKVRLTLNRIEGNEADGVTDTYYCYVKDNELPDYFSDESGNVLSIRVPKKYRLEYEKFRR